jgi:hypothetical protein
MSARNLRRYRIALAGSGAYAVWVTAESRKAACELAEGMLNEARSALLWPHGNLGHIEVLDEYEEDMVA